MKFTKPDKNTNMIDCIYCTVSKLYKTQVKATFRVWCLYLVHGPLLGQMRQAELAAAQHILKPCFDVSFLYNYGHRNRVTTPVSSSRMSGLYNKSC
jgi:hypothetical protein